MTGVYSSSGHSISKSPFMHTQYPGSYACGRRIYLLELTAFEWLQLTVTKNNTELQLHNCTLNTRILTIGKTMQTALQDTLVSQARKFEWTSEAPTNSGLHGCDSACSN